jgi:hypothetical protein
VLVAVSAVLLVACGQAAEQQRTASATRSAAARCLVQAGAHLANARADLAFFSHARAKGQAERTGSVFIDRNKVDVQLWTTIPDSGAKQPWFVWAAEPVAVRHASLPEHIVDERTPSAFVAYARRPSRKTLRAADICLQRAHRQ